MRLLLWALRAALGISPCSAGAALLRNSELHEYDAEQGPMRLQVQYDVAVPDVQLVAGLLRGLTGA